MTIWSRYRQKRSLGTNESDITQDITTPSTGSKLVLGVVPFYRTNEVLRVVDQASPGFSTAAAGFSSQLMLPPS